MWEVKPIMQGLLAGAIMSTQRSRLLSVTMKLDLSEFIQKKNLIIKGDFSEEWIIPRMQAGRESTLIKLKIRVK